MGDQQRKTERWQKYWDKHSKSYDREMGFFDRRLFRDNRDWVCSQATGDVLEVAVGTGLNLSHYPPAARLTGVEFSGQMLALARSTAAELGREITLVEGDAQALEFPDGSFDTVVCTYGLCCIPDARRAVAEMFRVLRPGGLLLLADHVAGSSRVVRAIQRTLELVTVPQGGEHFRRRPLETAKAVGFQIAGRERFTLGIVERVAARKPSDASEADG